MRAADRGERLVGLYLLWNFLRAASFRGYWLVTSLYLVVVADLTPFQLVVMGTAMEITVLLCEVPTGVMADTVSRKWSIVVSHLLLGAGMLGTGFVTGFAPLVVMQVTWGLGWTFSSGSDIAWITDELDEPRRIDRVLTGSARSVQYGAVTGMIAFGVLGWITTMAVAIVAAGAAMLVLGLFVAVRFPETNFTPTREDRWAESMAIFRRGAALARRDHEILLVFVVMVMISAGAEGYDRLYPKQLIELGFPEEPILWFMSLGVAMLLVGAAALKIVELRIEGAGVPRRVMLVACLSGAGGLVVLAEAPNDTIGVAGTLFVGGVAWTLIRSVSSIWVNRRTGSDVRATVQSFLGQTESLGEISGGIAMAVLAGATSIGVVFLVSAGLLLLAAATLFRARPARVGDRTAVAVGEI